LARRWYCSKLTADQSNIDLASQQLTGNDTSFARVELIVERLPQLTTGSGVSAVVLGQFVPGKSRHPYHLDPARVAFGLSEGTARKSTA
jgi:hypothetical protein